MLVIDRMLIAMAALLAYRFRRIHIRPDPGAHGEGSRMSDRNTHPRTRRSVRVVAPLALGAVVLLAWQAVTAAGMVAPTLLPPPVKVFTRFATDFASGALLQYAGITILEALLGCLLAMLVALPMGYLIARARLAEAAVSPYLAASQAVPAIAIAPLLVIWVGYGLLPIMLLCALLVFFPVVLATVLGLRTIDPEVLEAAQLDGANGLAMLRFIEWPLALPAVLTGLRNGFTLSVTGAVVGEFVMGGHGLGMVLSVQAASVDTTGLFATLVMLCLIAIVIYMAMLVIEALTDPLRPVADRRTTRGRQAPAIVEVEPSDNAPTVLDRDTFAPVTSLRPSAPGTAPSPRDPRAYTLESGVA
ncbi:MAG: ABC transporter permease [Propionibacteriaceae bacterium]|nr:ABC transporter permease [Propionibacteriaceae bacterium]